MKSKNTKRKGFFQRMERHKRPSMHTDERYFLIEKENLLTGLLRCLRISVEFMRGFYAFRKTRDCITVFGSSRVNPGDHCYESAKKMAHKIVESGFNVMSGGGPGVMEAATVGAKQAGGKAYACGIDIERFGGINSFVENGILMKYFFVRKVMLTKYSVGFIGMPGGFGTLDEVCEVITLVQTGKLRNFPIVLFGIDYWQPFIDFIQERLIAHKTAAPQDIELIFVTDSVDQAIEHIEKILDNIDD